MDDLTQLTRFGDRLTFLYLEKGHIEQHLRSVAYVTEQESIPIPAASLALLMLGPGTTITHAAVKNLADCNCLVAWCGDEGTRFYSHGRGGTYQADKLLRQAELYCNQRSRAQVVRRMYEKRFGQPVEPNLTIEQVRGREGYRVRNAYREAAQRFGLKWEGRNYDPSDWNKADPLNRALSTANACLHGVVHAGIITAGYSPAIGFIHTGKALSFVYDVADLYKVSMIVPMAFEVVSQSEQGVERRARMACRDLFHRVRLLENILPDVEEVLHGRPDPGESPSGPPGRPESMDDRAEGRDLPRPYDRPPSGQTLG